MTPDEFDTIMHMLQGIVNQMKQNQLDHENAGTSSETKHLLIDANHHHNNAMARWQDIVNSRPAYVRRLAKGVRS